jgi:hypothetical protein
VRGRRRTATFPVDEDGHIAPGTQLAVSARTWSGSATLRLNRMYPAGSGRAGAFIGSDADAGEAEKAGLHHSTTVHGAPAAFKLRQVSASITATGAQAICLAIRSTRRTR